MFRKHYSALNTHKGFLCLDKDHPVHIVTSVLNENLVNDNMPFSIFSHHTKETDGKNSFYSVSGELGKWKAKGSSMNKHISRIDIIPKKESRHIPDIEKIMLYMDNNELVEITNHADIKKIANAFSSNLELELVEKPDDKYSFKLD